MRPVVEHLDDVRARAGLDGRGDARLQVVLVDGLERHFHLHLLAVVGELALELGLALGNEVHTEEEMEPRGLGVGGRPPRGEDAREARRNAPEELPAVHHFILANTTSKLRPSTAW